MICCIKLHCFNVKEFYINTTTCTPYTYFVYSAPSPGLRVTTRTLRLGKVHMLPPYS